jgi:hypothetical protein
MQVTVARSWLTTSGAGRCPVGARPGAAGEVAVLGGGVTRGGRGLAELDHGGVAPGRVLRRRQDLAGLLLGHGARRPAGLAVRQVNKLDDVLADQLVDLGAADGAAQGTFHHHQRALAEVRRDPLEELVRFGGGEFLQLLPADAGLDPVLGLAAILGDRVILELQIVEPVGDALPDGVGGWRADTGVDLVVELVLGLGFDPAADCACCALAVVPAARAG